MIFKDENTPLVSIIMAVYNTDRYLSEAIDSVLFQTHKNIELIIVNDASSDKSINIIRDYISKDSRVVYLENKKNLKQSKTRNRAIKQARGEYIAIVDSDDICVKDRFEKQIDFLKRKSSVDVVGSDYCLFFNDNHDECETVVSANARDIHDGKPPVHNPTCMIKRSVFDGYGYYDSRYDNAEDVELWFRWFSQGVCFDNIHEILYKKRTHPGSVSIRNIKQQVYLMLKINLIALTKYNIRFTMKGYMRLAEQFLYLAYLFFKFNKVYIKKNTKNPHGQ